MLSARPTVGEVEAKSELMGHVASMSNARFYELGLTRDSRVIPGLTVVSVLSTSNLGLNWD